MSGDNFLLQYAQDCVFGKLAFNDCGPIWQFSVIAVLLVVAFIFLLALMTSPKQQTAKS